jgi:two-component system, cell cycle sensor histidine kinase and response regulator CckA
MNKKSNALLVLLVEDDPAHATAIQRALEAPGSDFEVKVVNNLREFRQKSVERPPSIALMDLNLPDGRATEVLTHPPEAGPFPVLVMTSYGNEQVAVEAIKAGALEYVVKSPEAFADMQHTVTHALNEWNLLQARKRTEETLEVKNVILVTQQETSLDGILVVDENGEIISFNRRFADLWGIPADMAEPKSDEAILQSVKDKLIDPDEFLAKLEELYRDREETSREEITLTDGRVVDRYSAPMVGEGGKHYGRVWYFRDVTDQKRAESEIQLSAQKLSLHVEQTPLAVIEFDLDGKVREWNPAAVKMFGYSRKEALGKFWSFIAPAAIHGQLEKVWTAIVGQHGGKRSTNVNITKDGRNISCEWFNTPLVDSDGRTIGVASLIQDVTERKKAEEAVRASEARFRTLIERAPAAIRINRAGKTIYVNQKFLDLYGFKSVDELVGRPVADQWAPEFRERVMDNTRKQARGEPILSDYEGIGQRKDGSQFPVQISVALVELPDGPASMAFLIDVTERKKAEEAVRASQERLKQIFEASPNVTSVFRIEDQALRRTWISPNLERIFGYAVEEALQPHWWSAHVHPEDVARVITDSARVLAREHIVHEYRFLKRDGSAVWIRDELRLLRDAVGRPAEVVGAWTDITERKELEAHLLRTQRLESVGRLASGIAHDLNNILSPMLMVPPLIREAIKDPELLKMVDLVDTNAQRGSNIIKQLLTFGRGMEGERMPVQLRSLVSEMSGIIRETFNKNIVTHQETPRDIWLVIGDATQLHQVLMNLCVNARDAMPEGGKLTLKLENQEFDESFARMTPGARAGRYVCLSVMDSGQGIAPEHLDKIFDPFFTTKELGKGTGLGLSTVLGIVQSHDGFIQVHSQPGRGTQFKIYLPASEVPEVKPAAEADGPLPKGSGELVLVVDDEKSVRDVTRRLLERNGYHVIEAAEGAEGITQYVAHQKKVQVVLTDLAMPVMDGPSFIRVLRRLNPQARVIAMTGYQSKSSLPVDLGVPAEDRLSKPFNGVVLLKTLHRMLHPESASKN